MSNFNEQVRVTAALRAPVKEEPELMSPSLPKDYPRLPQRSAPVTRNSFRALGHPSSRTEAILSYTAGFYTQQAQARNS